MPILTWSDLYYQLWTQAAQSRGTVTSTGTPIGVDALVAMTEWPRTNGADVIAIASLVDPILGALPLRPGGYGITRLWQSAVIELEGPAFSAPTSEHPGNRSLWAALLAVASYLDTVQASLPDETALEMLLDELWSPAPYRNAGGATKTIIASTMEKMWASQREELIKTRGCDVRQETAEIGGGAMKIPRSTNADVIRLADYWNAQVVSFLTKMVFAGLANTMGLEGQLKRWSDLMEDVDKLARKGKPDDVYSKNHAFWHETLGLATNLAVWGEVPSKFELAVDAIKQAAIDLPGRVVDAAAYAARAAGKVAHDIGAGFLSGLGKPLLIGGAAIVGLLVILRLGRSPEARSPEAR